MPDITDICSICEADFYSTTHYNWNTGKPQANSTAFVNIGR